MSETSQASERRFITLKPRKHTKLCTILWEFIMKEGVVRLM